MEHSPLRASAQSPPPVELKAPRAFRASQGEALEFYAITTPAWSRDDDVLVKAPEGAPR